MSCTIEFVPSMKHFNRIFCTSFFVIMLFCYITACQIGETSLPDAPPDNLSTFIEEGLEQWDIPGMAVAVIHKDSVVFAEGFGVRKLGEPDPVDEHTLFGVASISKSFTAAALGLLVEEGRIDWDDPIVDYLPDFQLYDPWVTQKITIRDALTHRSGLGRMIGNRLQYMTNRDRDELIYRLRYLDPEAPLRSGYIYNNMMYLVAGQIIPAITGQSWDDFVTKRLFSPLGMDRSNTSITQIDDDENAAWPHQEIRGEVVTIPRRNFDNAGPAASINTSVTELAQWVRLHLGEPGNYESTRLIGEEVMLEMHSAQTPIPVDQMYGDVRAYGLGWFIESYRGVRTERHGGATDGINTTMILVPELDLGVIVVSNTFSVFRDAVVYKNLDHYLGINETDWNQFYRERYERDYQKQIALRDSIHELRMARIDTSLPLERYTGRYYDDLYAELEVLQDDNGNLILRFWEDDSLMADLQHWEGDRFRAIWHNPAQREKFVEFVMGRRGVVEGIDVTYNLRPNLLQVGAYPSDYTRTVRYEKVE